MKTKQQTTNWKEFELGEILSYEQPTKYIVESTDYDDSYETPVLTAGKSFLLGHTNETKGIYENPPVIIFDDFTTANKYVDFKFKVKSSAMKLLTPVNEDINLKYVFSMMQSLKFNYDTHKRYYLSVYQYLKISLPILSDGTPDMKEQERIVEILEKAQRLKDKGKNAEELFDEYLKSIFYEMFYDKEFEGKSFFKVFDSTTGKLDSNAMEKNGKYPFFTCSQETFKINNYAFDCEALLLSGNNAAGKYSVKHYNGKFNAYQRTYVLTLREKGNFRYFHFVLTNKLKKLRQMSIGTNTKYLTLGILDTIKIPFPPLPLQEKFAKIVEQIEKMKEILKKTNNYSDELFNSLANKAFGGEL